MDRKPRIGLLTGGYFEFWRMYPGLDKIVEGQMQKLARDLGRKVDVVWSGLADTVEKTEAAGRKFREEDVDLCVICEGTYFPDFMPVQALEHIPHVPVLLLLTQPCDHVPPDMDYQQSTYHDFGSVGIVQLSGAFKKMGKKFEIIAASLDDDALCERVAQYAEVVLATRPSITCLRRHISARRTGSVWSRLGATSTDLSWRRKIVAANGRVPSLTVWPNWKACILMAGWFCPTITTCLSRATCACWVDG